MEYKSYYFTIQFPISANDPLGRPPKHPCNEYDTKEKAFEAIKRLPFGYVYGVTVYFPNHHIITEIYYNE